MSFVEDIGTRSAPGNPGEVLDDPYPSASELFHLVALRDDQQFTTPDDLVERPLVAGQSVERPDDGCLLSANVNSSIRLRCHYSAAATYGFSYTAGRDGATRRA